jgi:hypothetical protein
VPAVARGSAENPLSDTAVSEKFHALMSSAGFSAGSKQIEDLVRSIEFAPSISPLIEALTMSGAAPARHGAVR